MPASNQRFRCFLFYLTFATGLLVGFHSPNQAKAQSDGGANSGDTRPTVGLRDNRPVHTLLKDARVVVRPGESLDSASILVRGTSIISVGVDIVPPAGTKIIDCQDRTIYAGLIDAFHEVDVDEPANSPADHWNGNILPRRHAESAVSSVSDGASVRSQGITMRLLAPKGGIVKGTSSLIMFDGEKEATPIRNQVAQHLQITVPRDKRRDSYPNSPMGAVALLRQTLMDAQWYQKAWRSYEAKPELPRPQRNDDLSQLAGDMLKQRFIVDAPNERMAIRADHLASTFSIDAILRGSGREYRDLQTIAATGRTILVPVDFPKAPDVASTVEANDVSLRDLMHWHFAPQNPAKLVEAGVSICLTTDGLDDIKSFLKNLRLAVKRGLPAESALAAVTTQPATLLGVDSIAGSIHAGALANLVVTNGELFDDDTKIIETWVAGRRFVQDDDALADQDPLAGHWKTKLNLDRKRVPLTLKLKQDKQKLSGKLEGKESAKLNKLARAGDRLTAWVDLAKADDRLPAGASQLTIVTLADGKNADDDDTQLFTTLVLPSGESVPLDLEWTEATKDDEKNEDEDEDKKTDDKEEDDDAKSSDVDPLEEIIVNYPLGGLGVTQPVATASAVLIRGATVWTCSDAGVLESADVLIRDGKISQIGKSLAAPEDCVIIDGKGKHVTPGLIDCHSHMATDGGVNESGQAVTAEVRVGDFVDNTDINIYRQLAGGVTTANVLHGSSNPIGGQNQVVKLRWGDGMQAMKFAGAPQGIKFALGENVKRSNGSSSQTRYPASRMGVEQIMRDRFLAAQEYDARFRRWGSGNQDELPPRRDLELEAIAEILRGERWIHCHSYRQDEIVTLLDLLDRFGITIGTLQHILEGYKVADRMKAHGAMASSFSDWWAYKFEVYDAIADNGAIMHDQGIVVSFNSDDSELARHLNNEAAKATKYGGVPAEEALKFVTLNPAKQLRIDQHTGSLETGKDADVVLWSGPPLSTLARCEQTWVDGREMFSLQEDLAKRQRDQRWRTLLIQAILDGGKGGGSKAKTQPSEEERWLRYDEFCHEHNHDHDDDHDHQTHDEAHEVTGEQQ